MVITDYQMPGMDGFELITALQKQYDCPRIILMSGSFMSAEMHDALQSWRISFVQKPYEIGALQLLVSQTLRGVN